MRSRPILTPGDICRFHKRHRSQDILIVLAVMGMDSSEGSCRILVNHHHKTSTGWVVFKDKVNRRDLWTTGDNIKNRKLSTKTIEFFEASSIMSQIETSLNEVNEAVKSERPRVQSKGDVAALKSWAES